MGLEPFIGGGFGLLGVGFGNWLARRNLKDDRAYQDERIVRDRQAGDAQALLGDLQEALERGPTISVVPVRQAEEECHAARSRITRAGAGSLALADPGLSHRFRALQMVLFIAAGDANAQRIRAAPSDAEQINLWVIGEVIEDLLSALVAFQLHAELPEPLLPDSDGIIALAHPSVGPRGLEGISAYVQRERYGGP